MLINQSIIPDIKLIITTARDKAIRAVDNERTIMYWQIGKRIFEEEQQGKERAGYGEYLTKYISEQTINAGIWNWLFKTPNRIIPSVLPNLSNCEYTVFAIELEPV